MLLTLQEEIQKNQDIQMNARKAAVVAIIDSDNHIVLIQRNTYDGHHSGQMAFPGGKMDDLDVDIMSTAKREVFEEIGINLDDHALVSLQPHWIEISNIIVHPYYVKLDKKLNYALDKREINRIFEIPVAFFSEEGQCNFQSLTYRGRQVLAPSYNFEGNEIWGATAVIIYQLIQQLD